MGFEGFDFDFMSDDFFNVSKKTKEELKKETASEEKKTAAKKEKKASAGKGANKGGNFDCDVKLPVTVRARGFELVYTGDGTLKLSEIADKLVADGYEQLLIKNMGLVYCETAGVVYVVDDMLVASDKETLVDFSDEKTITVLDGQLKAVFSLNDFDGKEEDEVSLSDVAERFARINYNYAGCKLCYDEESGLAYPVMDKILGTTKITGDFTLIKDGMAEQYGEDFAEDFAGLVKKLCGEEAGGYVAKSENAYFVSYGHGKNKFYAKNAGSVAGKAAKKAEKRYELPMDLYVVTWNMHYNLTPDMFDGATKVTTEQITKVMATRQRMFADTSRKVDYFFNEDTSMMSCMFISGSKGVEAAYGCELPYEGPHTGFWKLIRSKAELVKAKALDNYLGIYCEGGENFKLVSLPHGNFLGFFGKEKECCDVKRVSFERKLPRVDRSILDHIIEYFRSDLSVEMMVKILYNKNTGEFLVIAADGERSNVGIAYDFSAHRELMCLPGMISVMDVHSHNVMPAEFSKIDDHDEQYPGVFGVIGNLDKPVPSMKFRCSLDGVFSEIPVEELFYTCRVI